MEYGESTLEDLGLGTYRDTSVFVTGHTGFKGSWLVLWLKRLGAHVSGYSLSPPTEPNHWSILQTELSETQGDICDKEALLMAMRSAQPKIVFHLAAQSLVKEGYRSPLETWQANLMGTATLLEVCREVPSVQAIVIVTTDKVYADQKWAWGYRENDELGGHDPYSASKAACELLVASYRKAFFQDNSCLVATARAGNVVGGGDFASDRLIPDLFRSICSQTPLQVRSPYAQRPWQHVLECLYGYLILGQKLLEGDKKYATSWNFGPQSSESRTVLHVLEYLQKKWDLLDWVVDYSHAFVETASLLLDSTRASQELGWRGIWSFETTLEKTAEWYSTWLEKGVSLSEEQLETFINAIHSKEDQDALQFTH